MPSQSPGSDCYPPANSPSFYTEHDAIWYGIAPWPVWQQENINIPEEILDTVIPTVWATKRPGRAKNAVLVKIELKSGAQLVRKRQYPIKLEASIGLELLINDFIQYGLLRECQSEYNTPVLPVRKPQTQKYWLVQDLREINRITVDVHPVVPNPYTLLSSIPENNVYFTVLDLKDAFFCIPLEEEILAKELEDWQGEHPSVTLLQYVDDILIGTASEQECKGATIDLLNFLGFAGYRVSQKKAQIVQTTVEYLGFEVSQGERKLSLERKEAICRIVPPRSKKELRGFLGMAGWCRLWIPNFSLIAKPLYAAIRRPEEILEWTPECQKSFDTIKTELMRAPALGLPNLSKSFILYVHERQHVALGVLTQTLGDWKRPVAYFSKQLDEVSKGWPACLRAVAAMVLLIAEAQKLTLGQPITIFVPHALQTVLEQRGHHWSSPSRLIQYQATLVEQDDVTLKVTSTLNPATLLPVNENHELEHNCLQVIEQVYSSRPDLKDVPLEDPDWELFTDGRSFVDDGKRKTGYAVVMLHREIEAKPLPVTTSAQKAEIAALTRALELSENMTVNIYTDSKYAFGVIHGRGAIWKERGLLSSQGTPIKHGEAILKLLQAVLKTKEVSVIHCKAHQKGQTDIITDETAKRAALTDSKVGALIPTGRILLDPPIYLEKNNQLAKLLNCTKTQDGWWTTDTGQIIVTAPLIRELIKRTHQETHMGADAVIADIR
ncbi:hypothetical protein QYF61_013411 [Mycteria americana]|uniref:ribonuclease H n=1 Tax=Mycteria americana TaxID=33587 RepID=A0AAN7RJA0_MYCAM|nr:hypothetical protein QYF61_013411 [Mycteria americana]